MADAFHSKNLIILAITLFFWEKSKFIYAYSRGLSQDKIRKTKVAKKAAPTCLSRIDSGIMAEAIRPINAKIRGPGGQLIKTNGYSKKNIMSQ